jgi:hypothetical protein
VTLLSLRVIHILGKKHRAQADNAPPNAGAFRSAQSLLCIRVKIRQDIDPAGCRVGI